MLGPAPRGRGAAGGDAHPVADRRGAGARRRGPAGGGVALRRAAEVARLSRVGGFVDPSVEAVMALHPDLVLAEPGPGNRQAVERMAELGAPVLLLPLGTVADVLAAERAAGKGAGQGRAGRGAGPGAGGHAGAHPRTRSRPDPGAGAAGLRLRSAGGGGTRRLRRRAAHGRRGAERGARCREPVPGLLGGAGAAEPSGAHPRRGDDSGGARPAADPSRPAPRRAGRRFRGQALLHPGPALGRGLEQLFALVHPEAGR